MSMIQPFLFVNQARFGAVSSGGGGLIGIAFGFFALFFFEPHYNALIKSTTSMIGINPSNQIVPLTVMAFAIVMYIGPIYVAVTKQRQSLLFIVSNFFIGIVFAIISVPLFVFSLIHWCFYTSK